VCRDTASAGKMKDQLNADVSVVILTKNSARRLIPCLKSVTAQRPGEIIAVDDSSEDTTLSILKQYDIKVIEDSSGSLGHMRNMGILAARRPLLMFVDSDIVLAENCLVTMITDLKRNGWSGVRATIHSSENVSYWQKSMDEHYLLWGNRLGPAEDIGSGASLYERSVLLRYRFDDDFSGASEDKDLCRRLGTHYKVGISAAVVYHQHRRELSGFARQFFWYGLGDAQIALKYKSIRVLTDPMKSAMVKIIYSLVTRRTRLIPYYCVRETARLAGLVVGVRKIRIHRHRRVAV